MKKNIILGFSAALALFSVTSCNQDLLNIQQKGVIAYEDFYQTDDDAKSALTAVYAEFINTFNNSGGVNNPSWNVVVNACGDELYWGGGKKNGSSEGAQDMNEFRNTYNSTIKHIKTIYKQLYTLIYKCNLVIDNFYGENGELLGNSDTKKQCVAEARVIRAWAHFILASYWGTPPLVDHVLPGDACPTNCDHQVLMDWVIKEYKEAIPDLDPIKGDKKTTDSYKINPLNAYALLGKAQVFNKDWAGAKESLKKVIDSNFYALVPGEQIADLFHVAGDGCSEKVLEMNYVYNDSFGKYGAGKFHYQRNQALFLRMFKAYPDVLIKEEGWGNNCAPTKPFVDAMMAHEPNSLRRKAWFASYEEMLTDYSYTNFKGKNVDAKSDGTPMTREEKLMDPNRGLDFNKYDELYANYGYFFMKFMPRACDLIPNNSTVTEENRIVMRYAEVLLLYAEACAQSGSDLEDGLKYLNKVAERAGAPTYDACTMANVKQEKWFELAWEGTRFLDLVRWGDAADKLAFRSNDETPYLFDEFYVHGTKGKEMSGKPHKARIIFKDDGWAASGGGFRADKHGLYPFPFDVIELNPWDEEKGVGLKQNPGWE